MWHHLCEVPYGVYSDVPLSRSKNTTRNYCTNPIYFFCLHSIHDVICLCHNWTPLKVAPGYSKKNFFCKVTLHFLLFLEEFLPWRKWFRLQQENFFYLVIWPTFWCLSLSISISPYEKNHIHLLFGWLSNFLDRNISHLITKLHNFSFN